MAELDWLIQCPGKTPLLAAHFEMGDGQSPSYRKTIHLKFEGKNPTGSMKDRTGYALLYSLEAKLKSDSVIIESTSGNLGVALALQCKKKGYPFVAVIDPKTTRENVERMRALGAQIELVDQPDVTGGFLLSRLTRVHELCRQHDNYIWTDQYSNQMNPNIHYLTTGPEIYQQMNEEVDAVFVPVSTGGTLAGIGRFFQEVSPQTRVIGVDARGSIAFGGAPSPRKLTGIGSSRRSSFLSPDLYHTYLLISDEEAFAFCRLLYQQTALRVGGSSGATLAACASYLAANPHLQHIVCVCADDGANYASSIFNEEWLQREHISLNGAHAGLVQSITLAEEYQAKG